MDAATPDFGQALSWLKHGQKVQRKGWNGKGMWLELQKPDKKSKMSLPYIYMKTACGNQVPWLASQTDMLSDDWSKLDKEATMPKAVGYGSTRKKTTKKKVATKKKATKKVAKVAKKATKKVAKKKTITRKKKA